MEIGEILAGKYRIDRVLGEGGMGVVVQATHLQLHQPVAVKFLLPEVLKNREAVARFLREAQAAVRLRSEHVARVIDVGTLETGAPYMVLEYLEGTDLAHYTPSQLDLGTVIDLMLQACEALAEAHTLGIVHRDIKPANFFVTRRSDGSLLLKVLDFGISKAPVAHNSGLTATQVVMGTPAYMSPEQMKSARDVDHRSDIWSLGIVMYQLLDGTAPFEADTFTSLVIKVATEPLRPLSKRVPAGLAHVIHRCLEKDPARRFADVGQLARALAPFARSATQAAVTMERTARVFPSSAMNPTVAQHPSGTPTTLSGSAGTMTPTTNLPRKRWPIVAGGAVVLGGIVTIAIVASSRGGADSSTSAAPAAAPSATPSGSSSTPPPVQPDPPPPAQPQAAAATTPPATTPPATATPATPPPATTPPPASAPATTPPEATAATSTPTAKATRTSRKPKTATAPKQPQPVTQPTKPPVTPTTTPGNDDILGTRN